MPADTLSRASNPVENAPHLFTTGEVAERLGCTPRTITSLITSGQLPAVRLGEGRTSYRVRPDDLADFISRHTTQQPPGKAA